MTRAKQIRKKSFEREKGHLALTEFTPTEAHKVIELGLCYHPEVENTKQAVMEDAALFNFFGFNASEVD